MKLCILLFAILGVATAAALPAPKVHSRTARSLSDDWADFLALTDTDAILEIVIVYLAEDEEVQAAIEYILSEDFAALVLAVEAIPEYIAFLDYLEAAGLNVYSYVNLLHELLGLSELAKSGTISRVASARISGGIAGLITDILATVDTDAFRALYWEKLESSEDFANLIAVLGSDQALTVYSALKANEEYQALRANLVDIGFSVDEVIAKLAELVGLSDHVSKRSIRVTRSLSDDLDDFVALVDIDAVLEILIVYIAEDAEVQAALEYALSPEFAALLHSAEEIEELVALAAWLHESGLPVYDWIELIHEFLGHEDSFSRIRSFNLSPFAASRITGGLAGLLADLLAIFPREEAKALFEEKLESSEDFATLIGHLTSDEAKTVVAAVKANEEYQYIRSELVAAGIDIDAIVAAAKALIGWE